MGPKGPIFLRSAPKWTVFEPRASKWRSRLDQNFNSINVLAHKELIDEKPKIPHFDHFLQSRILAHFCDALPDAPLEVPFYPKQPFAQNTISSAS